jgi:hypothetical protein
MNKFIAFIGLFLALSAPNWAQSASQYWTGDGRKDMSLAVLVPDSQGLSNDLAYLPAMVQGCLVSNISKYSGISVLDRVSLDKVIAETLDPTYKDNLDIVRLGHVAQTSHIMTGKLIKTSSGYTIQINVTDTSTSAKTTASYSGACTVAQLDNQTAVQLASKELLAQMGVSLTAKAVEELGTAATQQAVNAQTALAQGITAEKQGTIVQALSYFIQSSGYDPSLAEAASRMNILNANISSGNIGADTRNEIAWRRQWVARLQEAETFFANYVKNPPPYYLVYATDIQKGDINWQNETITLGFEMTLVPETAWMNPINGVISAVKSGLQSTGRAQAWELGDWPNFSGRSMDYAVVAEILNDKGSSIGRQTVSVPYGYEISDGIITGLRRWDGTVSFTGVKADAITDTLTIKITSIDGITAENASKQKNLSVMPETAYYQMSADRFATETASAKAKAVAGTLRVGERGPSGGFVFYDKGRVTDGWRYLEAAPIDMVRGTQWSGAQWGANYYDVTGTKTETGTGKRNTELIIAALNAKVETGKAAQLCRSTLISGYNDWFLPSKDELDLMYKNLKQKGLGDFGDGWYWSSSLYSTIDAWDQRFIYGSQSYSHKGNTLSVRAIRAF